MNNINFKLAGLTCEACVKLATNRFKKVAGVREVAIDLASGNTQIEGEDYLKLELLEQSLVGTPYTVVK